MAENLTVGHPSFYRGSGLEGRPLFAPNQVPNQGTPFLAAERAQPMQFGDKLRGYSLYQLPSNYVGVATVQPAPQGVPMYLNPNTQPSDPLGVFQRFRDTANGTAPVVTASQPAAQTVAQPAVQQQDMSVTQPQQVAAPQSVISVEALPRVDVPKLRPQQNDIRFIASQGVDALDGGDASIDFGRRYAAAAATGAVPVVSNAMLAALNRQHARNQAALSAATKAQDVNDMYAAMNDPDLRARAQALSKANGIPFDLAMRQAVQSKLMERGDYNLANRYEMSQILPQLDAEQQRRIMEANELGGSATPVRGPQGEDLQTSGINYLNTNPDGTRTIMTPNHAATVSQGAVTTYGMINGSSSPTTAAYNTALHALAVCDVQSERTCGFIALHTNRASVLALRTGRALRSLRACIAFLAFLTLRRNNRTNGVCLAFVVSPLQCVGIVDSNTSHTHAIFTISTAFALRTALANTSFVFT
jgi:hypothetical protein